MHDNTALLPGKILEQNSPVAPTLIMKLAQQTSPGKEEAGVKFIIKYTALIQNPEVDISSLSGHLLGMFLTTNFSMQVVSSIFRLLDEGGTKEDRSIPFVSQIMIMYLCHTKIDHNLFWGELDAVTALHNKVIKYASNQSECKGLVLINKQFYERYKLPELLSEKIIPTQKTLVSQCYEYAYTKVASAYGKALTYFIAPSPHQADWELPPEVMFMYCDKLLLQATGLTPDDLKKYRHIVDTYKNAELDNFSNSI